MDANEYALTVKPVEKSLGVLIRSAIWIGGPAREAPIGNDVVSSPSEATSVNESESLSSLAAEAADDATSSSLSDNDEPLASPLPPAPTVDAPLQINGDEIVMTCSDRRYRVRGLAKNLSFDQMKVNVLVSRGEQFHVDTIEMYAARQRALFIKQAAEEICVKEEVVKRDFGKLLWKLEELHSPARLQELHLS